MLTKIAENVAAAFASSTAHGFWNHDKGCLHAGCGAAIDDSRDDSRHCTTLLEHAEHDTDAAPGPCACVNRSLDMKVCLLHSELSEALEEYRLGEEKHGGLRGRLLYECPAAVSRPQSRRTHDTGHGAVLDAKCPRTFGDTPHKPVGFMSELADVCIRVYDLTGHLAMTGDLAEDYASERAYINGPLGKEEMPATFAGLLRAAHECVNDVGEALEHKAVQGDTVPHLLAMLLVCCDELAKFVGAADGALDEAIAIKMKFNTTRAPMHGKVC